MSTAVSSPAVTPHALTVVDKLHEVKDKNGQIVETVVKVRNSDGTYSVLTLNEKTGEGSKIDGLLKERILDGKHTTAELLNRGQFSENYTAPPPPPRPGDPLVISFDGTRSNPIDWIQNNDGTIKFLNSDTAVRSTSNAVLVYKDPQTGGWRLFRDKDNHANGIDHLATHDNTIKDGMINGKELEGIYLLYGNGHAEKASNRIREIRVSGYENVEEGNVRQVATGAVTLVDGQLVNMYGVWPKTNTLATVNDWSPEALKDPDLLSRIINNVPVIHSTGLMVGDLRREAANNPELLAHIEKIADMLRKNEPVSTQDWDNLLRMWAKVPADTGQQHGLENWKIETLRRFLSEEEGVAFGQQGHGVQNQGAADNLRKKFETFREGIATLFTGWISSSSRSALYNIWFDRNSIDIQNIRVGDTITLTNKTKMHSVVTGGRQGQMATTGNGTGEFVYINWNNGQIGIADQNFNRIAGTLDIRRNETSTLWEGKGAKYTIPNRWGGTIEYLQIESDPTSDANRVRVSSGTTDRRPAVEVSNPDVSTWIPPFNWSLNEDDNENNNGTNRNQPRVA